MTDRLPVTVTERPGPFQSLEFQMAWRKGGILIKAPPMLPAVIKIPAVTAMTWTAFAILVFFGPTSITKQKIAIQRGMTSVFTRNRGVEGVKRHMQNTHHIPPALQNATTSTTKAFKVLNCIFFSLAVNFGLVMTWHIVITQVPLSSAAKWKNKGGGD